MDVSSLTTRPRNAKRSRGFTIIELIVATALLMILTSLAIPLARVTIKREKERDLRRALWEMRDAIDRYKDAADRGAFQTKVDSQGYPPDLDTLVKGVDVQGEESTFPAPDSGGPDDRRHGLGAAVDAGRSGFSIPGAAKACLMCTPSPKAPGWTAHPTRPGEMNRRNDEQPPKTKPGIYPHRADDRDQHHADSVVFCDSIV